MSAKFKRNNISKPELLILKELRKNSRNSLAHISRKINIPISTIFDKLNNLEKSMIYKHVTLLDFASLGYGIRAYYILKAKKKAKLKDFLMNHPNVNTVHRTNNGTDFFIEAIFKDMRQRHEFAEKLHDFGMISMGEHFISEEVVKENFLTKPEHVDLVFSRLQFEEAENKEIQNN